MKTGGLTKEEHLDLLHEAAMELMEGFLEHNMELCMCFYDHNDNEIMFLGRPTLSTQEALQGSLERLRALLGDKSMEGSPSPQIVH